MAEAGYDPRAALDLWDLMSAVEADAALQGQTPSLSDRLSLLRTHPTSQYRQQALARLMPNALNLYKASEGYKRRQDGQREGKSKTGKVAGAIGNRTPSPLPPSKQEETRTTTDLVSSDSTVRL